MSDMSVHYSSARVDWSTPWWLIQRCEKEWGTFALDVCATAANFKAPNYFTPDQNGLIQAWRGLCWMNPPYGRDIGQWVCKAKHESYLGANVIALLPARTDTSWWHQYVAHATEILFLRGRIRFEGASASAPFPSAVVWFGPTDAARTRYVDWRTAR